MTLPGDLEAFSRIAEAERVFTALDGWTRVYGYPRGDDEMIHIIAPFEDHNGNLNFYRLDFLQAAKPHRGPRPAVQVVDGTAMTYEECSNWLIDLAQAWEANPAQRNLRFVIRRPSIKPRQIRIAWIVPQAVDDRPVQERLRAIGQVYGVEIVHVEPRGYRDTQARLAKAMPYDGVVVGRNFAPHITADAVPIAVSRDLILFCDSITLLDLETQIRTWIEITLEEIEKRTAEVGADVSNLILVLILRAMLGHAKIGEFKHCPRETVLKVIRGRRLNVPLAEKILEQNCEQHQDAKESEAIFLWKDHNDGRQYFLNPKRIEQVRAICGLPPTIQ